MALCVQAQGGLPVNLVAGVGITAAVLMMAVLGFLAKPSTNGGSVADLIKRGQLRSDRGAEYVSVITFRKDASRFHIICRRYFKVDIR
jgi:hypothetical protein